MKILSWHHEFEVVSIVGPHRAVVKCTSKINLMEVNKKEREWHVADKEFQHEIKRCPTTDAYYIYASQTMER